MKYIIILVLVLAGVLFFTKDKLFTNADNNLALVTNVSKKVSSTITSTSTTTGWRCTGPAPECSCLGMMASCRCDIINGVHTCGDDWGTSTTTETFYKLTLNKGQGDLTGDVVARPSPIKDDKGNIKGYKAGTVVSLTAYPDRKSKLFYDSEVIWSIPECKDKTTCVITMDYDKTVTYLFRKKGNRIVNGIFYNLVIQRVKRGAGNVDGAVSVTSSPKPTNEGYKSGTDVTITGTSNSKRYSIYIDKGDCKSSVQNNNQGFVCNVTMDSNKTVSYEAEDNCIISKNGIDSWERQLAGLKELSAKTQKKISIIQQQIDQEKKSKKPNMDKIRELNEQLGVLKDSLSDSNKKIKEIEDDISDAKNRMKEYNCPN